MEHTWDLLIHVESGREPSLGWSWSNAIRGWLLFSLPSWPRKVTRDGAKDSRTKPQKMVGYICIINKKNMHCVKTTNHIYIPQYIITLYIYPYIPIYTIIYPYIPIYNPINYICTQTLKNPEHFYAVPFQTKVAGSKSHGDESSNAPRCQELCQPKVEERWSRCYLWHLVASFAAVTADI
jgi:hypothetical protein